MELDIACLGKLYQGSLRRGEGDLSEGEEKTNSVPKQRTVAGTDTQTRMPSLPQRQKQCRQPHTGLGHSLIISFL